MIDLTDAIDRLGDGQAEAVRATVPVGTVVDIPIRSVDGLTVAAVGWGEVVGYVGARNHMLLVRWHDGVQVPYDIDQIAPHGRIQRDMPWVVFAEGLY